MSAMKSCAVILATNAVLSVDMKDNKGRTPVDLAREYEYTEVADYITNYKPPAKST